MAQPNACEVRFAEPFPVPPLAGEAVPDPLVGGTVVGGPAASTYREYYGKRGHVPPHEQIAGYLVGYRFTDGGGGIGPTPAALRDQKVTLSDRQPMTFLCLTTGADGTGEVSILHRFV